MKATFLNKITCPGLLEPDYMEQAGKPHMTMNKDSMLPCSLIMLIRVSITINVPVLPIPALKKNSNDSKTSQPINLQIE